MVKHKGKDINYGIVVKMPLEGILPLKEYMENNGWFVVYDTASLERLVIVEQSSREENYEQNEAN